MNIQFEIKEWSSPAQLKACAEFLLKLADAAPVPSVKPADAAPVPEQPAPKTRKAKAEQPAPAPEQPAPAPASVTLEQVRAVLKAKSDAGKRQQVQALVASYGVQNLTQIPQDKLADVLAKGEAL